MWRKKNVCITTVVFITHSVMQKEISSREPALRLWENRNLTCSHLDVSASVSSLMFPILTQGCIFGK